MAKDKIAGKITYDDVKAGEQEVNAKQTVFEAILQQAIVKFGIKGKKLNRKAAAEASSKMADWIMERMLTEGDHNPLYDAKNDAEYLKAIKGGKSKYTPYQAHQYMIERKGFNKGQFVQDAMNHGLTREAIEQHHIPNQTQIYRVVHQNATVGDVTTDNLDSLLGEIEKEHGIKFAPSQRSYDKAVKHIRAHRVGALNKRYIQDTPGVYAEKKKAA